MTQADYLTLVKLLVGLVGLVGRDAFAAKFFLKDETLRGKYGR
jgi:hypothetical protein